MKGFSVFAAFFGEELEQIWPDALTVITNEFLSDFNLESVGLQASQQASFNQLATKWTIEWNIDFWFLNKEWQKYVWKMQARFANAKLSSVVSLTFTFLWIL